MTPEIEKIRHSLAHLLAMAVLKKHPSVKLGIGPIIENGFYYDFDFGKELFSDNELPELEKIIKEFIKEDLVFKKEKIEYKEAQKFFENEPYKSELIEELKKSKDPITIYKSGDFIDLCAGPHVKSTKEINPDAFKLTRIAGAYWRGSEKNPMLTRIYGVAFETKQELDEYLKMMEEVGKRDHKILGPRLELFKFHETAPGMPYWLPKGLLMYNELINFWRVEHQKRGYQEIKTPLVNKRELYEISGHWEHYKEDMFIFNTRENESYALKPMNCPNAMIVFKDKIRSYKDLPLRLSDTDALHRFELSGTLNGLLRVREFSQDDAHIFVLEDQIKQECERIFEITKLFYSIFGLGYSFRLGTRPLKFMGDVKTWNKAEKELKNILKESGKPFVISEGDGAFYGPKIDIIMKDLLNRDWQMGTIQLDFQIPKRFDLTYTGKDGKKQTPVVIHRVIYGSIERFMGILTENFAGAFPLWITPIQAVILNVGLNYKKYAEEILGKLKENGIRVEIKDEDSVGKRIREAELQKIPYIIIVGEKELQNKSVNVRHYRRGQEGEIKIDELLELLNREIKEKII